MTVSVVLLRSAAASAAARQAGTCGTPKGGPSVSDALSPRRGYDCVVPANAAQLIERARALVPLLEEHAAEAERLRRPHDAVMKALEEAELFKLMVPIEHGGFELDLDTFLDVGLVLGEGDGSMSWVTTFYIEHCWMFAHFPEAFQREIFDLDARLENYGRTRVGLEVQGAF